MTRVLIIGGAGFIGSHLAQHCITRGDDVQIVVRPQTDLWRLAKFHTRPVVHTLDLGDRVALDRCFREVRADEIYHLAFQTRRQQTPNFSDVDQSINADILNLINILAAAAATKPSPRTVVRAGSLAEYGNGPAPYNEDQRENPLNAYTAALTAATHYTQMLQPRLPFSTFTARLALAYGPDQDEGFLIPTLVRNCQAGKKTLIRRPDDRRDLIYVTEVAEALCRLASSALPGGTIVNIATGIAPPVTHIADLVARAVGADPALIELADPSCTDENDQGICINFCGSPALARKLLGWEAKIPVNEGLQRMLDVIQDRRKTPEVR